MSQKGIEMALIYLIEKEKTLEICKLATRLQRFGCSNDKILQYVTNASKGFDEILKELRS